MVENSRIFKFNFAEFLYPVTRNSGESLILTDDEYGGYQQFSKKIRRNLRFSDLGGTGLPSAGSGVIVHRYPETAVLVLLRRLLVGGLVLVGLLS